MGKTFTKLVNTETLKTNAVSDINNCFNDTKSRSSSGSFPTTDLEIGMLHYNSPESGNPALYVLEALPAVWTKLHAVSADQSTGIVGNAGGIISATSSESSYGFVSTAPVTSSKSTSSALLSPSSIKTHMYANTVDPGVVELANDTEVSQGTRSDLAIPYSSRSRVTIPEQDTSGNGWYRFSNGLTYCWGLSFNVAYAGSGNTITFPVTFSQVFTVNVTMMSTIYTTLQNTSVAAYNVSNSGFTIRNYIAGKSSGTPQTVDAYWLAIGLS